jgi:hypothetical protein
MTSVPIFTTKTPSVLGTSNQGAMVGLKIQPASDASGDYVPVVAIDGGGGGGSETVTGTVTANAGTNLNTSALALETGGNLATIASTVTAGKVKVDPSGVTSPVSAASLPLPANAAQETGGNLATLAGTVSAGKVQSTIATALPAGTNLVGKVGIDQTTPGVTNKVSIGTDGTVIANAGTNLNTSALALETGGNLATLAGAVSAAKVQTTVATALPAGTNTLGGIYAAPTASSSFGIAPGSSSALEASHVLKASAGNLYSLYVMTTSVGGYLMTFNAISAPSDGAVTPVECIQIPANSAAGISWDGAPPDFYSTGIVAVFSTTGPFTKTASATAFFKWRVQ